MQRVCRPSCRASDLEQDVRVRISLRAPFCVLEQDTFIGYEISCVMEKPTFYICEKQSTDQLGYNHAADQPLSFYS